MWLSLEESFAALSSSEKEWLRVNSQRVGDRVVFPGFSVIIEVEYLSAARFMVDVLEKYEHSPARLESLFSAHGYLP